MLALLRTRAVLSGTQAPLRTISTTIIRRAVDHHDDHHAPTPPMLLGEGAKAGEVPTDLQQATGLERLQLLGNMEGIDVFDMKPLEMTRLGTMKDPIPIHSLAPERIVGCTGYPADSHDTLWLSMNTKKKNHRCPECGCVYTLQVEGGATHAHH